jgi:hypothetical protein
VLTQGHIDATEYLLSRIQGQSERVEASGSALLDAAYGGHEELVRLLVREHKAPVDVRDEDGDTPLMLATMEVRGCPCTCSSNEGRWRTCVAGYTSWAVIGRPVTHRVCRRAQ